MCRQRRRILGGDAAHVCEIPAFAGMVYLGTGDCGRNRDGADTTL